jgi:hypothetical protein
MILQNSWLRQQATSGYTLDYLRLPALWGFIHSCSYLDTPPMSEYIEPQRDKLSSLDLRIVLLSPSEEN